MVAAFFLQTGYSSEIPEKPATILKDAIWNTELKRWAYLDREKNIFYQWYKDGTLETRGLVSNNKPFGTWEYWGPDGKKMMEEIFENGEAVKRINYKIYFPDSQRPSNIPKESKWDQKSNIWTFYDKKNETAYSWFINGEKKYFSNISPEGIVNGKGIMWFQNGQIEREEEYVDGKADGLHTVYNEKGNPIIKEYYKNDEIIWTDVYTLKQPAGLPEGVAWNIQWKGWKYKKNDKVYILYDNGKKKCEIDAKDLDYHGKFTMWQENGIIILEGNYVNSKKEGKWVIYNKSGTKVHRETVYKNNKEVSQKILTDFDS